MFQLLCTLVFCSCWTLVVVTKGSPEWGKQGKMLVVGKELVVSVIERIFLGVRELLVKSQVPMYILACLWVLRSVRLQVNFFCALISSITHECFFATYWILAKCIQPFFVGEMGYHFSLCLCQILWFCNSCVSVSFSELVCPLWQGRLSPVRLTAMRNALRSTSRSLHSFIYSCPRVLLLVTCVNK